MSLIFWYLQVLICYTIYEIIYADCECFFFSLRMFAATVFLILNISAGAKFQHLIFGLPLAKSKDLTLTFRENVFFASLLACFESAMFAFAS